MMHCNLLWMKASSKYIKAQIMTSSQRKLLLIHKPPHLCTAVTWVPVTSEHPAAVCMFGSGSVLANRRQTSVETPSYGPISAWGHWEPAHPWCRWKPADKEMLYFSYTAQWMHQIPVTVWVFKYTLWLKNVLIEINWNEYFYWARTH